MSDRFKVLVSRRGEYSLWPAGRENPLGWKDAGKTGDKQACLDYIEEVWTDLRALSRREKMARLKEIGDMIR